MCLRCQHQGHTLSMGAPSSMCPEYSSCSPDESPSCPDCSHFVSLRSVVALRSCSFSSLLLLGRFFFVFFLVFVHRPDVPCGYSRCFPGCQKGSQPCSFLSAFTAPRHKSPKWRPFFAQVNVSVCCRRCFCDWSFFFTGRVFGPTQTPLSSGRVGPALVASYDVVMHGRAVGLFYAQPTGTNTKHALQYLLCSTRTTQ